MALRTASWANSRSESDYPATRLLTPLRPGTLLLLLWRVRWQGAAADQLFFPAACWQICREVPTTPRPTSLLTSQWVACSPQLDLLIRDYAGAAVAMPAPAYRRPRPTILIPSLVGLTPLVMAPRPAIPKLAPRLPCPKTNTTPPDTGNRRSHARQACLGSCNPAVPTTAQLLASDYAHGWRTPLASLGTTLYAFVRPPKSCP